MLCLHDYFYFACLCKEMSRNMTEHGQERRTNSGAVDTPAELAVPAGKPAPASRAPTRDSPQNSTSKAKTKIPKSQSSAPTTTVASKANTPASQKAKSPVATQRTDKIIKEKPSVTPRQSKIPAPVAKKQPSSKGKYYLAMGQARNGNM